LLYSIISTRTHDSTAVLLAVAIHPWPWVHNAFHASFIPTVYLVTHSAFYSGGGFW